MTSLSKETCVFQCFNVHQTETPSPIETKVCTIICYVYETSQCAQNCSNRFRGRPPIREIYVCGLSYFTFCYLILPYHISSVFMRSSIDNAGQQIWTLMARQTLAGARKCLLWVALLPNHGKGSKSPTHFRPLREFSAK